MKAALITNNIMKLLCILLDFPHIFLPEFEFVAQSEVDLCSCFSQRGVSQSFW